ncbi:nudC domain-containing protein 3 [Protopterus annectens]|uniref:nudC domain-containing protein 3 n=1 Tax=Protopterus annectens TaxID=7888 RepID=UPI001CFA8873|nr:nudC domain-containing protein 3 [Protopterus annectens]
MSEYPGMSEMYDHALLGILQHGGTIQRFLEIYFGFLYRKTDFFRLLSGPEDKMGFPPGVAEKMVLKVFKVFEHMAVQDHQQRMKELEEKLRKKLEEEKISAPPASEVVEIETTAEEALPGSDAAELLQDKQQEVPQQEQACVEVSGQQSEANAAAAAAAPQPCSKPPQQSLSQEHFQGNSDSYNGAIRDNYMWSQDYTDLEIKVSVPKNIVRGRQVSVDIQTSSIRVAVFEGNSENVLMEGKLMHRINTEGSLWSLEPGKCILINLNKSGEYWWNAILEGEQAIDIDKINRERSMATVDEEEHAVLDRLTFDYHQKLQGKPQSHEMKVHEMLKKGWDAEGSPFKGQQFDPSMFNISPGAVQF